MVEWQSEICAESYIQLTVLPFTPADTNYSQSTAAQRGTQKSKNYLVKACITE